MHLNGLMSATVQPGAVWPVRVRMAFLFLLAIAALLLLAAALREDAWALTSLMPTAPFRGGCSASPVPC